MFSPSNFWLKIATVNFVQIFIGPKQSKQSSVMRGLASSPEREWDTTPCGSYARVRSHPIPDPSLCSAGGDPFRTRVHPSPSLRRYRGCLSEQLGEAIFRGSAIPVTARSVQCCWPCPYFCYRRRDMFLPFLYLPAPSASPCRSCCCRKP